MQSQPRPDLIQSLLDAIAAGDDEATERVAQEFTGRASLAPALGPLLAAGDIDRRWWAVRILPLLGGNRATEMLIPHLTDPNAAIRCAAALGLGQLGAVSAIAALVERLADESGWVRDSAADALAMLGEPAAALLVAALTEGPDGVRVRAASALRRIVGRADRARIGPSMDIRSPLGQAVGGLFRALQDPNYLVHQHAHAALESHGLLDNLIIM